MLACPASPDGRCAHPRQCRPGYCVAHVYAQLEARLRHATGPAWTVPQVALVVGVKADKILAYVRAGELPAYRLAGVGPYRLPHASVVAWLRRIGLAPPDATL